MYIYGQCLLSHTNNTQNPHAAKRQTETLAQRNHQNNLAMMELVCACFNTVGKLCFETFSDFSRIRLIIRTRTMERWIIRYGNTRGGGLDVWGTFQPNTFRHEKNKSITTSIVLFNATIAIFWK